MVATEVTKSVSLILELTDDLQTGMQLLLLPQEMCEALEVGELKPEMLKTLVMAIIAPRTSADGKPGKEP